MFEHRFLRTSSGGLHYVVAGQGVPLLLLHGWPQTWYAWRHVAPLLVDRFRLIMPDLRGLGDSTKEVADFSKKSIAAEIAELLAHECSDTPIDVAGHDWGGPVAAALALFRPTTVRRLMIIDVVIPGDGRPAGMSQGGKRWHHFFHGVPDLPETLTAGRERTYLEWFLREYSFEGKACQPEALDEYVRTYSMPHSMHNGFEYYRAAPQDASDNAARLKAGQLTIPVCCVSGTEGRGRGEETLDSVRLVAYRRWPAA